MLDRTLRISIISMLTWLATGCVAPDGAAPPEEAFVAEGDAVRELLALSEQGAVLLAAEPFGRVGLRWDVRAGAADPELELRCASGELPFGDWQAVRPSWADGVMRTGHVDLEPGCDRLQLGLARGEPDDIGFLFVEPLSDWFRVDDGWGQQQTAEPLATSRQALAPGDLVNSRASWGARATRCGSRHTPNKATIHHTDTPNNDSVSPEDRIRGIQRYHMDSRGWCDIGYHFLVSQDGRLWQGRDDVLVGAHVGGHNTGNAGISFLGNYSANGATDAQLRAAGRLVAWLKEHYGISSDLFGHRDLGQTACPGDALYAQLGQIEQYAGNGVGPVDPQTGTYKGVVYIAPDVGQRLAGARVWVEGTDRSAVSDDNGFFSFELEPGTYTVSAELDGYERASVQREVVAGAEVWGSIGLTPAQEEPPPDVTPPQVVFVSPQHGSVVQEAELEVVVQVDDLEVEQVQLAGEAVPRGADELFRRSVTLQEGDNLLSAIAHDAAGNEGRASISVLYDPPDDPVDPPDDPPDDPVDPPDDPPDDPDDPVDPPDDPDVPPSISILQPQEGQVVREQLLWVLGQVDDQSVTEVIVNDEITAPVQVGGRFEAQVVLDEGDNVISCSATSTSTGLTGTVTRRVTYVADEDPPDEPGDEPDGGPGEQDEAADGEQVAGAEPETRDIGAGCSLTGSASRSASPLLWGLGCLLLLVLRRP